MPLEIELQPKRKTERVACAVEPELREMLKQYADDKDTNESVAMRYILGRFLRSYVKKTKLELSNSQSEHEMEMA